MNEDEDEDAGGAVDGGGASASAAASSDSSATPLVSVVLVNFRTPKLTLDCIASLARHSRRVPTEIIVVDNASGDDSLEQLRSAAAPISVLPLRANVGFGGGCNAGAAAAWGKYVYLLNTDTLLEMDAVGVLADFLENNPGAVAAGSRLRRPEGTRQRAAFLFPSPLRLLFGAEGVGEALERRFPFLENRLSLFVPDYRLRAACRVDWCSGASLMVRTDAYRAAGGFDPAFFLYSEEIDLCRRLARWGETWFVPEAEVIHLEGASQGASQGTGQGTSQSSGPAAARRFSYMAAGRRLYYAKHHSAPERALLVLADAGGAAVKGSALWAAGRLLGRPAATTRAAEQLAYAANYFRVSYPLK